MIRLDKAYNAHIKETEELDEASNNVIKKAKKYAKDNIPIHIQDVVDEYVENFMEDMEDEGVDDIDDYQSDIEKIFTSVAKKAL